MSATRESVPSIYVYQKKKYTLYTYRSNLKNILLQHTNWSLQILEKNWQLRFKGYYCRTNYTKVWIQRVGKFDLIQLF